MARFYCNSEFDHAAMVLKFASKPAEIFFLEATSTNGVCIRSYRYAKTQIGNLYEKIVLRHLEWKRPDKALINLEKFVREVRGRAYNLSFDMLRKR